MPITPSLALMARFILRSGSMANLRPPLSNGPGKQALGAACFNVDGVRYLPLVQDMSTPELIVLDLGLKIALFSVIKPHNDEGTVASSDLTKSSVNDRLHWL
jgi:hypothetical protein